MAESTLPVWVFLSIAGGILILVIPHVNYHLSRMSKMRIQCLKDKPEERRSNSVIGLKRWIDEKYYPWIVLGIYMAMTISFCVGNHAVLPSGEHVILQVLLRFVVWLLTASIVVVMATGLMGVLQDTAIKDLKNYYESRFHVTIMYLDKIDLEEYYNHKTSNY